MTLEQAHAVDSGGGNASCLLPLGWNVCEEWKWTAPSRTARGSYVCARLNEGWKQVKQVKQVKGEPSAGAVVGEKRLGEKKTSWYRK